MAVRNFTVHLASNYGDRYRLPKKSENPFKIGNDPKLDSSPELEPDSAPYCLTFIGILRWMIKFGRIDKITNVSLLSSHAALPREG